MSHTWTIAVIAAWLGLTAVVDASLPIHLERLTPLWFTGGMAVAVLYMHGTRYWPLIPVIAAPSYLALGISPAAVAILTLGTVLEGTVGAYLLRKRLDFDARLGRVRDVVGLVFIVTPVCALLICGAGLVSSMLTDPLPEAEIAAITLRSFLSNTMGILVVAPLMFAWGGNWRIPRREAIEWVFLLLLISAVSILTFMVSFGSPSAQLMPYILFPFALWAAMRFGARGVSAAVVVITIFAVYATLNGYGAFVRNEATLTVTLLVGYFTTLSATMLLLVAILNERKQLQDELERFFAQALDMLCIATPEGYFRQASPAFTDTLGWSREEFLSKPFIEFVHPEDRERTRAEFEEQIQHGKKVIHFENRYQHRDGSWRILSWKSAPQPSGDIYAIARDVTEHRETEERVRRTAEELATILVSIGEAIITTDARGVIRSLNPTAELLTGWMRKEAVGRPVGEVMRLVNENTRQPVAFPLEQILKTGTSPGHLLFLVLLSKSGAEHLISYSAASIRSAEHEDDLGLVIAIRDVTLERQNAKARVEAERQRADLERLAREAADSANQAKSAFLANMSHEIRTPMNAILGFAQILGREPGLSDKQRECVETINRAGNHLLTLINDILEISKIEAGRITLSQEPFDLLGMIADLETMFRSRGEAKGLQLLVEVGEQVPRFVVGDEAKLRQVFINLLSNAVKFTDDGGVALRITASTDNCAKGNVRLAAEVEDTGHGIDAKELPRLFHTFEQTAAGQKAGGTGLGLAISKKLVELMGGTIGVRSELGKGSCFRFDAVLQVAEEIVPRERTEVRRVLRLVSGLGTVRALVVDDNEENRRLMRALLEPAGFAVAEAKNGAEALTRFDKWAPHVVLMDMRMPDMDGYEATRRLKATTVGRKTPVVAVTASAFETSRHEVMGAGVDEYLRKPFRANELFNAIQKVLDVSYEYADETDHSRKPRAKGAALERGELHGSVPAAAIERMAAAVQGGDMGAFLAEVEALEKEMPGNQLPDQLRDLAENYAYDKLLHLLDSGDKA